MTTLLLNTLLVLLTLFFGVMAYYPLFASSNDTEEPVEKYADDVVISVAPAPFEHNRPTSISSPRPAENDPQHPWHRPAA
jgi:hypothetical protein